MCIGVSPITISVSLIHAVPKEARRGCQSPLGLELTDNHWPPVGARDQTQAHRCFQSLPHLSRPPKAILKV